MAEKHYHIPMVIKYLSSQRTAALTLPLPGKMRKILPITLINSGGHKQTNSFQQLNLVGQSK